MVVHPTSRLTFSRRQCLQVGVLNMLGLSSARLSRLRAMAGERSGTARRRNNCCVFIFLFGGPSQLDLWDMKPAAPREIRGEFQPIATDVPGMDVCEHLPLLARQMDKVCLLRSLTHRMNVHGPACSEVYSGREYFGPPVTDQARPEDWPSLAALVKRFAPARGMPSTVTLPWYTQFVGQARRIAGQTGGRMGEEFNPFLVQGDVSSPDFEVQGLTLPSDMTLSRLRQRRELVRGLQQHARRDFDGSGVARRIDNQYTSAFSLIESSQAAGAFDLKREQPALRERYGRTRIGQSLLLARRLVEAGVSLVTVNWDDNHKDDKVSPHWDTHVDNFPKLKDRLCPPFDRAMSAFLEDLAQRGLLDTTLVVAVGEFGRTPRVGAVTQNGMTKPTGRDHWPHAFTALLAGGGVRGGQVYGETVKTGGYVKDKPVTPADLAATVLHHLGVDPTTQYEDRFLGVMQQLSVGSPVKDLG